MVVFLCKCIYYVQGTLFNFPVDSGEIQLKLSDKRYYYGHFTVALIVLNQDLRQSVLAISVVFVLKT